MPTLHATLSGGLQTTPIGIMAEGFAPGSRVQIEFTLGDDLGVRWSAQGLFDAGHLCEFVEVDAPLLLREDHRHGSICGTDGRVRPDDCSWGGVPDDV